MVGEVGDSQVVVNLPVTNVPGCTSSNAKTLGLKYLQFPDLGASGGPPNGARIVHHGPDELFQPELHIGIQFGLRSKHAACRLQKLINYT